MLIVSVLIILISSGWFLFNFSRQIQLASQSFQLEESINELNIFYKNYLDLVVEKRRYQTLVDPQNKEKFDQLKNVLSQQLDSINDGNAGMQQFEKELDDFTTSYELRLEQLARHIGYFDQVEEDLAKYRIAGETEEIQSRSGQLEQHYQKLLLSLIEESDRLKREYFETAKVNSTAFILLFSLSVILILTNHFLGKKQQKLAFEKQFQKIQLESAQRDVLEFKASFDHAAIGMALVNDAGKWIRVNSSLCKMLEYAPEELMNLTFQEITHPEDLFSDLELAKRLRNREIESYTLEKRYFTKSGEIVWVNLNGTAVWEKDGGFRHFIAQIENITTRKKYLEELHISERKFKGIFNSTFQFIGFLEPDGTLVEANQTALDFAALKPEDVVGKKFWDCYWWQISTETQHQLQKAIQRSAQGEFVQYEVAVWDRDKNPVTILFNLKPLRGEEGQVIAIIPEGRLIQDIVDARKSLQEKNLELERFASVASHDLKEPLRMVISFLQLLQRRYEGQLDEKGQQYIHLAVDASKRMNSLISELLDFSRLGTEDTPFEWVESAEVVQQLQGYFNPILLDSHGVIQSEGLPKVYVKKVPFELLLRNLIGNSLKYRKEEVAPQVYLKAKSHPRYWEFSVQDNGIGFDPAHASSIFQMFQRLHTQQEYGGTGMGLAICKRIVEQHQGEIWAESIPGEGSVFRFTIRKPDESKAVTDG
jgi:PAS domain S-box-containing protein